MSAVLTRPVSTLPPGTAFSRFVKALSVGDRRSAVTLAADWKDTPQVLAVLENQYTKAAVGAATTTDGTWAGPLAAYGIAQEALQLLRGRSIIGALEGSMRRVPFRTKVSRETGSGTGGAWIGEGAPIPVSTSAFDLLSQEAYKACTLTVFTLELARVSGPSAEQTLRQTIVAGLAKFLDEQFLTSTVTAIANVRPAAITNGATAVTSTGTTEAQIRADLTALIAAITTPGDALTWIMRRKTAARIAATLTGSTDIPRTLFGIPLVLSANSPQQITLVDASELLYSDEGGFDVDVSEEATLQLDTAPADPTVATSVMDSLFQRNLSAIKCTRWLAYQRAQTGAVAFMTTAY